MAELNIETVIKSGVEKALNKPIVDGKSITEWAAIGMKAPRWISVKDRLPEERINPLTQDFAEVICFCDFGGEPRRTDVRTYKFGKPTWDKDGHFLLGGQIMDGVITHWQYLPEPPKEDDA